MRDRVEPRGRSDAAWLRNRQRRIEYRHTKRSLRIATGHFDVTVRRGNQRVTLRLASGAGRRWNRDHRQHWFCRFAVPAIILHATAVGENEVDALGAIHRTAAAEPDDRIDLFVRSKLGARIDHTRIRVYFEIVKADDFNCRRAKWLDRFVNVPRRNHAVISHKQDAPKPQLPGYVAQAADSSGAENHPSTGLKVERL